MASRLPAETHRAIGALLEAGELSQREIARRLRVNRKTVDKAARRLSGPDASPGPKRRCPTCGGMVEMPCRLCEVRHQSQPPEE